jgi:hypothetical protein
MEVSGQFPLPLLLLVAPTHWIGERETWGGGRGASAPGLDTVEGREKNLLRAPCP